MTVAQRTADFEFLTDGKGLLCSDDLEFADSSTLSALHGLHVKDGTQVHPQSADASFSLSDVTIGVNFHWERKETQTFLGTLRFVVESDKIVAINELPVEKYLESVISSEMSATSSLELLKAHAVISRSWLLAQMQKRREVAESGNNFYEFVETEYRKVLEEKKVREKDFDIDGFLNVLEPYYKGGEYDYLLNSDKELDLLHKRFIVFEIDSIKDHPILFPVTTIIIMELFINKMRRLKGIRKMIVIEEAWKAIASANMASYIKYLYKTVRKFFGEAVVVTQEVEDIISSAIVKDSIINNSDCKILLDQRKFMNKFEQIQSLLGLTEKEKSQILSINQSNDPSRLYKEVWIGLGGTQSAVYATEVSTQEYLAYTTEESEKLEVRALAEKLGGDMEAAIRQLAEDIQENK